MSRLGLWFGVGVAVAAMAGSVLFAAREQQVTAETNFSEAQTASDIRASVLEEERGLDGYLITGSTGELSSYFVGAHDLAAELGVARGQGRDDPLELALVVRQAVLVGRLQAAAKAEILAFDAPGAFSAPSARAGTHTSDALIAQFLTVNDAYIARLTTLRQREEARAALIPVWLVLGLSVCFGAAAAFFVRRTRRARTALERVESGERELQSRLSSRQARFAEAMQVSESQREAHAVLTHHLEETIPKSTVVILNRNNSADRLEPTTALPEMDPLLETLESAKPRSCLAVRLSRPYARGGDEDEVLSCAVCGRLASSSTCQPLLVGGEVIGSVLVRHEQPLAQSESHMLVESVSQSAPVLANLRNLALAENRAATDSLTGLPNRRSVDDTLKRMLAQAARSVAPMSLVLADLDHFKNINDTFGHDRGDEVLAAFGALLRNELRESDLAGRTGGEEFVLLLPNTDRPEAARVARKIQETLHRLRVTGVDQTITASFGVASFPTDAGDASTLLRSADRALYSAKRQGRDRIETAVAAPAPPGEAADRVSPRASGFEVRT